MYKALKVKLAPGKKLTFNFSITFNDDGTTTYRRQPWNVPIVVPPDHPDIIKTLQRGDISLVDVKEPKPKTTIKKEV